MEGAQGMTTTLDQKRSVKGVVVNLLMEIVCISWYANKRHARNAFIYGKMGRVLK